MRNHYRPTHNKPHTKNLEKLLTRHTHIPTFRNVITDAIVAAQNHGRDEPKHLFRLRR